MFGLKIISRHVLPCKFSAIYSRSSNTPGTHQWSAFVNNISIVVSVLLAQHWLVHGLSCFFPLLKIVLVINGHISSALVVSETERVVFTAEIRIFVMNKLMWDTVRRSLVTNWKGLSHVSILFFWLLSQNIHSTLSDVTLSGDSSVHIFLGSFANCLHILVVWFRCMLRIDCFYKI